jgi:hypothetical protein
MMNCSEEMRTARDSPVGVERELDEKGSKPSL